MSSSSNVTGFRCATCGAEADVASALPWRCPNATRADRHHILQIVRRSVPLQVSDDLDPFVAYGAELAWQAFALAHGMSADGCAALVRELGGRLGLVEGFRATPFARASALSDALGFDSNGGVWVKDETGNVAGSHKARHLVSVLLHLEAAERLGLVPTPSRLAIASCGNAALAAATLAAAGGRELEVFVPPWADARVVDAIRELRASVTVCPRRDGAPPGDPCVHRFRDGVADGAVPFGVQGPENALSLDGGRTIGWEMAQVTLVDRVFVQVGGGALASCIARAFADAGLRPRLHAVQAEGCAPLARAWQRATTLGVAFAPQHWVECMWPWEDEPHSAADGILDDETYDWIGVVEGMAASEGSPVVVSEQLIKEAHELAMTTTGKAVSVTGTAGLAGLLAIRDEVGDFERVAIVFSGVER